MLNYDEIIDSMIPLHDSSINVYSFPVVSEIAVRQRVHMTENGKMGIARMLRR
jgi:hypothetical protein